MSSDGSLSSWSRDGVKARFPRSRDGQQESGLRSGSRGRPAWMDRVPHRPAWTAASCICTLVIQLLNVLLSS